jgi:hypothetical protein
MRKLAIALRADAYADAARSRIETDLCRSRQSRADRDCRPPGYYDYDPYYYHHRHFHHWRHEHFVRSW